jgi:c(7)-type cytochrome triheme protein
MKDTKGLEKMFEEFSAALPMSSFGNGIDWAAALNKGLINPANSILSDAPPMQLPPKLKVPIKLGTTSPRSDVTFSHEEHFADLDCSSCHPDVFNIKKKGTEAFTMERNVYGNFCGVCHMQVAFPMQDCRRCHPSMSNSSGY